MRVIKIKSDKSLYVAQENIPEAGEGQVLIQTHFAALNRADLLQRDGDYPSPPGWPDRMGLEISGEVVAVGKGVRTRKLGDRVCALLGGGGYAEYVAVNEGLTMQFGDKISYEQAAAIPEAYSTAYLNLFFEGNLKKGETVLVFAGASGVGIAVTQLAKAFGGKVIATVRSERKAKTIEKFGADQIINTKVIEATEIFNENAIDLVIDCVGGAAAGRCLTKMNRGGRWINIATLGGDKTEVDLHELYKKGIKLIGSTLRSRPERMKEKILRALEKEVLPQIEAKNISPQIYKIFDLSEAEEAQTVMRENRNTGKILLRLKK